MAQNRLNQRGSDCKGTNDAYGKNGRTDKKNIDEKGQICEEEQNLREAIQFYVDANELADDVKQQLWNALQCKKRKKGLQAHIPVRKGTAAAVLACVLFAGGIGVNSASGDKVADTIYRAGGDKILSSIRKICGIEPESAEIIQNMTPESEVYAPPLLECTKRRAIFATSRGMVIYDRKQERIAATVDLQKIGCNYFTTQSLRTKVLIDGDWMRIFNCKEETVQGDCYSYDLSALKGKEGAIVNLEPSEVKKAEDTLPAQWEETMARHYRDTFDNAPQETMEQWEEDRKKNIKYSEQAVVNQSSGKNRFTCLLLSGDEYQLYTWVPETGEDTVETLQMISENMEGAAIASQEKNALPPFAYSGDDPVMKAVCDYLVEREKLDSRKTQNDVMIPGIVIHDTVEEKDTLKVFGNFWTFIYYRNGNTLEENGGGEMPACMHLKKKHGAYQVVDVEETGDGEYYQKGIAQFCEGYPEIYEKFFDFDRGMEQREKSRKKLIRQYVTDNQLDIQYYHDFGWDPVELF